MSSLRFGCFALATLVMACGARVAPETDGRVSPLDATAVDGRTPELDAPVPTPDGARPCAAGQRRLGDECVDEGSPQPIAPLSLATTTKLRPRFRWALPRGATGARVELCRDRACTMVITTVDATGTSVVLGEPLPARSTVFWRLRARSNSATDTQPSATWLFHTPAVDLAADSAPNTSTHPRLDLNGDGFDDVAIGARFAAPNGLPTAGAVRVSYGSARPTLATNVELAGASRFENFGTSVASAGDMDGDGYGDLIVGAPFAPRNNVVGAGRVAIYFGGPSGVTASVVLPIEGGEGFSAFGSSVSSAGDLNGDGFADVLIGSPRNRGSAGEQAGAVSVLLGNRTARTGVSRANISGATLPLGFGQVVSGGGDINGDGLSDFAVLAARDDLSATQTLAVFLGRANFGSTSPSYAAETARATDLTMGDLDHDGRSDIVAATFETSPVRTVVGQAYLGRIANRLALGPRVTGPVIDGEGTARARIVGDINGDGFDDLALSSPQGGSPSLGPFGAVTVVAGSAVSVGAPILTLTGDEMNAEFGQALSSFCDHNGDGTVDLLVTSPRTRAMSTSTFGRVDLFFGVVGAVPTRGPTVFGLAAIEHFGWSVASLTPPEGALRGRSACRLRRPALSGC